MALRYLKKGEIMKPSYKKIDFVQARQMLDADPSALLLDVRTEQEYIVEHASGAVLFPLDDISAGSAQSVIPDKSTAALVYCRTGRRSLEAAERLLALGYENVYDLGSLEGWPYGKDFGE
jgi:phage shock protein E